MTFFKKTLSLALVSVLLFACSSDDKITNDTTNPEASVQDTYVSFSLEIPNASSLVTRAAGPNWAGRATIKSVDIYLVNVTKGTVDANSFSLSDFDIKKNELTPKKAILATSGEGVKAYAIVNGVGFDKLKDLSANQLDEYFSNNEYSMTNFSANAYTTDAKRDVVMMTNAVLPTKIEIAPEVSQDQAKAGQNTIQIGVQRIAARGIVTSKIGKMETGLGGEGLVPSDILIPVPNDKGKEVSSLVVTSMSYAIGLNNKQLFLIQKTDKKTPAASYNYTPKSQQAWKDEVEKIFDYTALKTPVPVMAMGESKIEDVLNAETTSQFVLPVTHAKGDYHKGNTTYFEITVKVKPSGDFAENTGYTEGADVYVGKIDGLVYATEADVRAKNGEYFTLYKKGVMKYIVWLNPDDLKQPEASPTHRNTVYHANIINFKKLGFPTNPLDPTEPIDPTNPVDPTDPLDAVETYLTVQIQIVDWNLVSNDIEL